PTESYTFDPSGNLTSLTVGNTTTSFAANSLNQQTAPGTHVYDAKGQKTTLDGKTFEWDDQGRITAVVVGTQRSEFAYDGMSRRTKITEFTNGAVTSKKLYFWLGGSIVCERDGLQTGFPKTKQYFGQGEVRGATKLYYATDHLGSIRELVDSAGTVQAEYAYSTYGERTKVSGNLDSDWGYAGLWHHQASGLDLATYRAYDAANKRWISRDPLGEGVDYNLYRYCGNDPIGCQDPLGLKKAKVKTLEFNVRSPVKTCFLKITVDVYYDDDTGIVSFENGQVSGKLPVPGNLAIGIDTSFRTKTTEWEGGDQESTVSNFDKYKPFNNKLEGIYPVRGPGANGGQVDIKVDIKMNLTYISPKGVSTKSDSNTTGWFGIGLGPDFQIIPVGPHFGRNGGGGIPGISR
ncbi:RHS repeat-associated core domain-containing protein, partial [bacterium]|nr:RHS repeat-associated core domain-containing protein [bacterium]